MKRKTPCYGGAASKARIKKLRARGYKVKVIKGVVYKKKKS